MQRVQQAEAAALEAAPQPEQAAPELDQWLIDFAGLFRDHLGIEPDRHLDLTQQVLACAASCLMLAESPGLGRTTAVCILRPHAAGLRHALELGPGVCIGGLQWASFVIILASSLIATWTSPSRRCSGPRITNR